MMETDRRPREGRGGGRKRIVITDCEVTPIDTHGFGSGVRGLATITLNNALVLRSLRIIKDRDDGLSVAFPTQMARDKTWQDIVEPKSESLREEVSRRVLAEYARAIARIEAAEAPEEAPAEPAPAEGVTEPTPTEGAPEPQPTEAASEPEPAEVVPEEPTSSLL